MCIVLAVNLAGIETYFVVSFVECVHLTIAMKQLMSIELILVNLFLTECDRVLFFVQTKKQKPKSQ